MSLGRLFGDVVGGGAKTGRDRVKVSKTLVICSLPRSGSNLLAEVLTSTRRCGMPLEYFNHEYEEEFRDRWDLPIAASALDYLAEALNRTTTPNGVFGLKIHWHQLSTLLLRLFPGRTVQESIYEISYLLPDIHYVYLSRRDKLRQAVSYARALQTNTWWRIDGVRDPLERCVEPHYDPEQIATLLKSIKAYEVSWEKLFYQLGRAPLRLVYEDLVLREAAMSIMALLDNSSDLGEIPAPRLRRQADGISEEWVSAFRHSVGLENC